MADEVVAAAETPAVEPVAPTATSVIAAAVAPAIPDPSAQPEAKTLGETIYGSEEPVPEVAAEPAAEPVVEPVVEGEAEAPTPIDWTTAEITLPEGMTVDDTIMGGFRELAAATNLDQPTAQKFIDLYTSALTSGQNTIIETMQANWSATQTKWVGEINAMPEFQGEQADRSKAMIGRVLDEFGTPEVREAFETTGAGNNPAIVRMILNLSSALLEGEPALVGRPSGTKQNRTLGERLYGTSNNS